MYFDTVEEYTTEIALVRASIRRTVENQSYSRSGSGTDVSLQRTTLELLRTYLKELISERDALQESNANNSSSRVYAVAGRRYA